MRPAPNSYSRKEKKEMKAKDEAESADPFLTLVQKSIEDLLKLPFDRTEKDAVKERNASIANAIKFIMVRNRMSGDDGSYWGSDDD